MARTCDPTYFRCANGRCIPGRWRCDHDDDCGDGSDEVTADCADRYRNCSIAERPCGNGECLHAAKFCDGAVDCGDRSDELFCDTPCDEGQFQCGHPRSCVLREWRCDGEWDCVDGSDEGGCLGEKGPGCAQGEVPCGGRNATGCVNAQWICDGEQDCPDGADEADCEGRACEPNRFRCQNDKCVLWSGVCDGEKVILMAALKTGG